MTDCCLCCTEGLLESSVDVRVMAYLIMKSSFVENIGRVISVLDISKKDLGTHLQLKDNRSIKKKLMTSFYNPDYMWYEQIPGRLDIVRVPDYYNDEKAKEKYNFNLVIDQDILKELMTFDERYLKAFMYLHKNKNCYKKSGGFNESIGRINSNLKYGESGQNVSNLKEVIYKLREKGYIDFKENPKGITGENGHYVPTIYNVKTYTSKNKIVVKPKEEIVEIVKDTKKELSPTTVEEISKIEEKIIEVEDWQKELAEKMLGRSISTKEYEKMLAKKGTLVTKEQWERNGGMTGQRTQEEYEGVILDRIKQVLKIV